MDKRFLEECLARGMSLEAIGELAGKHPSTVSCWLKKHGLTAVGQKRHAPKGAVDADRLREMVDEGVSIRKMADELGVGYSTIRYWLKRLGLETERSVRRKEGDAAREAGLRTAHLICGFDEHQAALQFHHRDRSAKSFHLSHRGMTRGIGQMRAEARKCVLLCANCHALVEAGVKKVPDEER